MPSSKRRISHPILRRDVIRADGTRTLGLHVFCQVQETAVPVGVCCACPNCASIEAGACPSVTCEVASSACREIGADETGLTTPAGLATHSDVLCVEGEVDTGTVSAVLSVADRRAVVVVDARGTVVGLVHEARFLHAVTPGEAKAFDLMSAVVAIDERTPIRLALRSLAHTHLREIPVVSRDGAPLGTLRDVDALLCFAAARRKARG